MAGEGSYTLRVLAYAGAIGAGPPQSFACVGTENAPDHTGAFSFQGPFRHGTWWRYSTTIAEP